MAENLTLLDLITTTGGSLKTGPFGTQLKAAHYASEGVPVISVGEIGQGMIRLRRDTPRVDAETTARLPEFLLRTGDIVFARKGAVERTAFVRSTENGWFLGSDGIRLRLENRIVAKYVAYQLQTRKVQQWLLREAPGSTLLSLNHDTLHRLPLTLPELPVQAAIAEVLGALDDKIAASDRIAARLADLSAMRFAAAQASARLGVLSDVLELSYGKALPAASRSGGPVPVVGSGGVVGWHDQSLVPGPSVVIGRKGSVGATYWLDDDCFPIDTTFFAVPRHGYPMEYLFQVAKSLDYSGMNSDSAVPGLNRKQAEAMSIRLIDPPLAHDFANLIRPTLEYSSALRRESVTLARLRDTLLPHLMSGRLTVKQAEATLGKVL